MHANSNPLRLAVIGCGHIWRTIYRPIVALQRNAVRLEAVCDRDAAAADVAAAAFPGARVYLDAADLLEKEAPDAVLVLTSESANASVAAAAVEAGVPVYLEKPPAVSVSGWELLRKAEEGGPEKVFAAFNRRHTPLFRDWICPEQVRRVRGVMSRRGRAAELFPYTAVHLIDSAQYFSGQTFEETQIVPGRDGDWRIVGTLSGGADCDLTFVPNGNDHCEYLVFEARDETWEMHFPNPAAERHAEGRLICAARRADTSGRETDPLEAMGYAPCFRTFLETLNGRPGDGLPHRVEHCLPTIALLEEALVTISRCIREPAAGLGELEDIHNPSNDYETPPIS